MRHEREPLLLATVVAIALAALAFATSGSIVDPVSLNHVLEAYEATTGRVLMSALLFLLAYVTVSLLLRAHSFLRHVVVGSAERDAVLVAARSSQPGRHLSAISLCGRVFAEVLPERGGRGATLSTDVERVVERETATLSGALMQLEVLVDTAPTIGIFGSVLGISAAFARTSGDLAESMPRITAALTVALVTSVVGYGVKILGQLGIGALDNMMQAARAQILSLANLVVTADEASSELAGTPRGTGDLR